MKEDVDDYFYEDEPVLYDICPNCGRSYDEIDYEFQICHRCGYKAEP